MKNKVTLTESVVLMCIIIAHIVACVRMGLGLVAPLFLSWVIIYLFNLYKKNDYKVLEKACLDSIRSGFQSIAIVLAVGVLIGTWIISGTVPTLIYYGLKLIHPNWFLVATLLICSILSLATGTSYGSAGSGGLAMMGIGIGMGFSPGMIAGAVICGALFGDKMSPFSDTTNLAPAMAGGDLFKHIGSMCWTTIPPYIICLIIFAIFGFSHSSTNYDPTQVVTYMEGLKSVFNINPIMLLPIILVIVLLIFKTPAIPAILIGAISGGVVAVFFQDTTIAEVVNVMHKGYNIDSGIYLIDRLLNRGGVNSMTDIACIMIFAMGLGGMLEKLGVLANFLSLIINKITSTGRLILSTLLVAYITGAIGCTMSMSHVITGKLMAPTYRARGIEPEILSRTMEDAGTLGGTLMPWHTNAVFFTGALGVTYGEYIPFVFICFLTPIFSLIYGYTGITIKRVKKEEYYEA